jgi:hypothetical protein
MQKLIDAYRLLRVGRTSFANRSGSADTHPSGSTRSVGKAGKKPRVCASNLGSGLPVSLNALEMKCGPSLTACFGPAMTMSRKLT